MPRRKLSQQSLEVFLLGSFRIKVNGRTVEKERWERRAAANLVKLLALQPQHQLHREQIIDLLWAEQDIETAGNSLNKAIHTARRALEPSLIRGSDSQFILTQKQIVILSAPGGVRIDAAEFERLAEEAIRSHDLAVCETALELYRGDLLLENLYEDWLSAKREYLRILYRNLAFEAADLFAAQFKYERSIELLKTLIIQDSLDEQVHQSLMRCYALSGNKYQAIKQFEMMHDAFRQSGLTPEPESIKLKEQIQTGEIQPISPPEISNNAEKSGEIVQQNIPTPQIRQLTFQQGVIQTAGFSHAGNEIIYSAAWEENRLELYTIDSGNEETRSLGIFDSNVFSVNRAGEIALALDPKFSRGYTTTATLARLRQTGETAREILDDVEWADWHPDEKRFAGSPETECFLVVRSAEGRCRLEHPVGTVLFETGGWISYPRFSPDGKMIAFIEHPTLDDDGGAISIVNLKGEKQTLSDGWISAQGLSWNKAANEIWFTATKQGNARSIFAVSPTGKNERLIYKGIGSLTLQDVSEDGTALITVNKTRIRIIARASEDAKERDLSWHDWSLVRDLSPDGKTILFTEAGESGGALYATYIRDTNGSPARRLGNGSALAFSPDGKFALVRLLTAPQQLALISIEAGTTKPLEIFKSKTFSYHPWAAWLPNGKRFVFAANEDASGTKLYLQDVEGEPRCITPNMEGVEISSPHSISPDGRHIAFVDPADQLSLLSIEDGSSAPLPKLEPDFLAIGWSENGEHLYLRKRGEVPAIVYRYEIKTGQKEPSLELMPKDKTGVHEILRILLTPDGKSYAYSYTRDLSDLYVIEGLR